MEDSSYVVFGDDLQSFFFKRSIFEDARKKTSLKINQLL